MTRHADLTATAPVSSRAFHEFTELSGRGPNFRPVTFEDAASDPRWRLDQRRSVLPGEAPGPPRPGGSYEVAREVMIAYGFADPSVVRAVYDPTAELGRRDMLLVGRFFGLRFHMGVRMGGVVDEQTEREGRPIHRFRWRYHTLQGHLEHGQMDCEVLKWLDTGEVEFRIRAYSRRAHIRNPIVRAGFMLFGRVVQLRFYRRAMARMQVLVAAGSSRRDATDQASTITATEEDHMGSRYSFAFDPRFAGRLRLLGIRPDRAWVDITDRRLEARFGPWRVSTPLTNIAGASLTGPHRPLRAIGPRFSPSTRSLTFGSNVERTVRIAFRRPVPGMEPLGIVRHPSLSVSVADPQELLDHLDRVCAGG